jgi:hypothetical protein
MFLFDSNMVLLFLGDPDNKRKQVVREKTAQYLLQAEKIYNQHLASKSAELSLWDVRLISLNILPYFTLSSILLGTFLRYCYSILI